MRRSWFVFKQIYLDMEQLQSGRGVLFVIFELRSLATKSKKMTVWFGVCADKGSANPRKSAEGYVEGKKKA